MAEFEKEVATALLYLPTKEIVFQRRSPNKALNPNMLGLFGGHKEPCDNDDFAATLARELEEETSLRIGRDVGELCLGGYRAFAMLPEVTTNYIKYQMYDIAIESPEFELYDGAGVEVYSAKEALARDDLEPAINLALTLEVKRGRAVWL